MQTACRFLLTLAVPGGRVPGELDYGVRDLKHVARG